MNNGGYYIIRNIMVCTAQYSTVCTVLKSRRVRWDGHAAWRGDIKYNLVRNFFEMAAWKMDTTRVTGYSEYRALPQIPLWTRIPPWPGSLVSKTWKGGWPTGSNVSNLPLLIKKFEILWHITWQIWWNNNGTFASSYIKEEK